MWWEQVVVYMVMDVVEHVWRHVVEHRVGM